MLKTLVRSLLGAGLLCVAHAQSLPWIYPSAQEFTDHYKYWVTGVPYSVKFYVSGGTGCGAISPDKIPAGFTWTPSGTEAVLAGTFPAPGKYVIELTVKCSNASSAYLRYTVTVSPPLSLAAGPYLSGGNVGVAYQTPITQSGAAPFTFKVTSGALPAGFSFNKSTGALSGSPATQGVYTFQLTVTDNVQATASGSYILVAGPPGSFYTTTTRLDFVLLAGGPAQTMPLGVSTSDLSPATFTVASDAPWVSATPPSGSTPANLAVRIDPSKLPTGASQAHLQVTPGGGKSPVTVTVNAEVRQAVPMIGVAPQGVEVELPAVPNAAKTFQLGFQAWNAGSGTLNAQVSATTLVGTQYWLTVQPTQITAAAGQVLPLTVNIDASTLSPGTYQAAVQLKSATQVTSVPVVLVVPKIQYTPSLRLSSQGVRGSWWTTLSNEWESVKTNAFVYNDYPQAMMNFTAELLGFSSDATMEPKQDRIGPGASASGSGDNNGAPLRISFRPYKYSIGRHEGMVQVTAPGALNSPAFLKVGLDIIPADGVLFTGQVGKIFYDPIEARADTPVLVVPAGSKTVIQTQVTITNSSNMPVSFTVSSPSPAVTFEQDSYVAPANGSTVVTANVDPAQLKSRVNVLEVDAWCRILLGTLGARVANMGAIQPPAGGASAGRYAAEGALPAAACAPSQLVLVPAAPPTYFNRLADWPADVQAVVYDDCGNPVKDATVTASFSNGDPARTMALADAAKGVFQASWIPGGVAPSMTVTLRAVKAGLPATTAQVSGAVVEDAGAPVVFNGGIVSNVNPVSGAPASPGSIVSIYGKNLASGTAQAQSVPLPRQLAGTTVLIGGVQAPLFFASPGQINAQVPTELAADARFEVVVQTADRVSTPKPLRLAKLSPGIAAYVDGHVIAQHLDYSLVNAAAPAKPGEYIILYLVGMGPTDTPVPTGTSSPSSPLAYVASKPAVTISGISAEVYSALLTPGGVGLYQVAVKVPEAAPAGDLALVLTQENAAANTVTLPVGSQ